MKINELLINDSRMMYGPWHRDYTKFWVFVRRLNKYILEVVRDRRKLERSLPIWDWSP